MQRKKRANNLNMDFFSNPIIDIVQVISDYDPGDQKKSKSSKIVIKKGEIIKVLRKKNNGWWKGKKKQTNH